MLRVRTVDTVDDFLVPGDPGDLAQFLSDCWDEGDSRPEWCFVVEEEGNVLGRIGFTLEPSTSDPAWLGTLPPAELHAFGLRWQGSRAVGEELLEHALSAMAGIGPSHAEIRINRRSTPCHADAVAVLESMGAPLFQEKAGFEFDATTGDPHLPDRLTWSTVDDLGVERYASIMARCGEATLDRNDRYYWSHCGAANWGMQMMEYLDSGDSDMWLVGFDGDEPVGYVFVTTDPVLVSTIGHIGVLPEARGRGHVHDLLGAVSATLSRRRIPSMLSDIDVLNEPMRQALLRAGHRESEWHVWHYRPSLTRDRHT